MLMSLEVLEDAEPPPVEDKLIDDESFKPPGKVFTAIVRETTR
jgi:hypothetical protein